MVLQSVTRAVTRATARRRGCFFSKSGLRFSFCPPSFFFLFSFSTRQIDSPVIVIDRWLFRPGKDHL